MAVGLEMDGQQRIWGVRPAGTVTPARLSHGRWPRTRRRARLGARVRQTGNRGHPRARGRRGVALRSRRRPEGKAGARAPWPAAWSTPASADKGLRAMIQNGNWTGRKRRSRRAHHGRKSEAGMKRGRRTTVSSGRRTTAIPARRLLGHGRRERERGEAAGGAGKGSAPFL